MITATGHSPHATTHALPAGSVALTGDGPLARLRSTALEATIPTMGALLFSPAAGAYDNFLVAAGGADGDFVGPPFMDGDFYKWLEAASVAAGADGTGLDAELEAAVDTAIDAIVRAQDADGYLQTKTQIRRRTNPEQVPFVRARDFETYNLGHLMTFAATRHRATGDTRMLEVAQRAAEFLIHTAEHDPDALSRCNICPSHYMGAVELHRETADPRYLDLARRLLDLHGGKGATGTDDNQDVEPVRDQRRAVGHAVRANYLYAGMADVAIEDGDPALVTALEAIWRDLIDTKIAITGGVGALYDGASPDAGLNYDLITRTHQAYGRPYQHPHVTAYNESCASLGFVFWAWRMLVLTGRSEFADEIERVLHNALPAMVGVDGSTYFYTNPLRQLRDIPFPMRRPGDVPGTTPPPSHERGRQEFMRGSFCCPPNIARVLAELPYYVYSVEADGLRVHQFAESSAQVELNGVPVTVRQRTAYPAEGRVEIAVQADAPVTAAIRVRIPGWAPSATVTVDGAIVTRVESGYAVIEREWSGETRVVLDVDGDLAPRLVAAHPLVEEATAQVAVVRGPVVYCLESADLPSGVGVERIALPTDIAWGTEAGDGALDGVVLLRGQAVLLPDERSDRSLYRTFDASPGEPLDVRLVPYGRWANRGPGEMTVWMPVLRTLPTARDIQEPR